MKHGIVTNGRNTTYYGNEAQKYMARQAAMFCDDQERATRYVTECGSPDYRAALVSELRKMGFEFDEKLIDELNQRDIAAEAKTASERLAKLKETYRDTYPEVSMRTTSKCAFCKLGIKKGTSYYDGGKGRRAHTTCVAP